VRYSNVLCGRKNLLYLDDSFHGPGHNLVVSKSAQRVGNDSWLKPICAQGLTLYIRFMKERIGKNDSCWCAVTFEGDRVVQTARRAGSSITDCGHDSVGLAGDPVYKIG